MNNTDNLDIYFGTMLLLSEMGFDFDKNSARDLINAIEMITELAISDDTLNTHLKRCIEDAKGLRMKAHDSLTLTKGVIS